MSVKENFNLILEKIEKAAERSGRKASDITLVAVTKYASIDQMKEAYSLSLRNFGESRLQKAQPKIDLLPKDIHWHFIGPIQSNKIASIISFFNVIHSVSSLKIAKMVSDIGFKRGQKVTSFFQIDFSKDQKKNGFSLEEFLVLQEDLLTLEGLEVLGLMTMAPQTKDEKEVRRFFRDLHHLQSQFPGKYPFLSMGMSEDFEIAIEEGSSHVRIGSGLFSSN